MSRGRHVTLADLQAFEDGPDLSPLDISRLTEGKISDDKVRADIQRGFVLARVLPVSKLRTWRRIPFPAARVYLRARGFLGFTCHTSANAVSDLPVNDDSPLR